jgi:hypothetical protein
MVFAHAYERISAFFQGHFDHACCLLVRQGVENKLDANGVATDVPKRRRQGRSLQGQ